MRAAEHAAYVAMERWRARSTVRRGSFVATHKALASAEAKSLVVEIVPGTGTEGLAGISGTMHVDIVDKQHLYTIEYSLPPVQPWHP